MTGIRVAILDADGSVAWSALLTDYERQMRGRVVKPTQSVAFVRRGPDGSFQVVPAQEVPGRMLVQWSEMRGGEG